MSEQKKLGTQGSLIFMNTPIADSAEDVIGFSTYVEKLDAAIASGGQMIALTSPFGAGKTSIAELLQNKYKNDAEKRVVKVSMWSHLASGMGEEQVKGDTTELHKGFVYQLITQINRRKGQYISRLLNPSFGLLKLQINKVRYWLYTIAALILFLFGYILPKKFDFSLPFLGEKAASWEWVMVFSSAVFLALIVTRAEVVFSSNKSEGGRKIDTNEIMQLYRAEVLGYKLKCCNNGHHYIAVIEDLDRTDDNEAVINFLKELRRYYVPENELNNGIVYKNRVTFLINVKPEALLYGDKCTEDEHEHLYAKLFDFVLNLQTINIDDYNTILEGLLQQKKDELRTLGFNCDGRMIDIPGMRWMTRGKRLGIREIKDRLNTAFSLYESLNKKFGDTIEFEKCALSAFIVTEYEADFHATDDLAFQKLVSAYLKGELNDSKIDEVLSKNCTSYKRSVRNLIESKQINNNYRIYFYSYPRAGRVLSSDEAIVQQAILYDEAPESLEDSIQKVVQEGSSIIRDSIEDRNNLGLMLPDIVFRNEELYIQSLKYAFPKVVMWVQKLDYSTDASEKTIEQLKNLLRFDPARTVYSKKHAQEFVKVWEEKFSETALLQFRKLLCHEFPQEISLYTPLFFGVHKIVSIDELQNLKIADIINIVNENSDDFSIELVDYIVGCFQKEDAIDNTEGEMERFLNVARKKLGDTAMLFNLLTYQKKIIKIVPAFESVIVSHVMAESDTNLNQVDLLQDYQQLVNLVAENGLSAQTKKNISALEVYTGYSSEVTTQMEESDYVIDFVLQTLSCGHKVQFERADVITALHKNLDWIIARPQIFLELRASIINEKIEIIRQYQFMFNEGCPIMTENEFIMLKHSSILDRDIMSLLPPTLVTENEIAMLVSYFCRHRQSNNESYEILLYISRLRPSVAKAMFYALNFDMIRYRYIASERRNKVKKAFWDILALDEVEEKIRFMTATRILDSAWENQMRDELNEDEDLRDAYVAAVRRDDASREITKTTVQILCSFSTVPAVQKHVYRRYYELGYYKQYVSCATRDQKKFEMEGGERGALLWPVYVEIFGHSGYEMTWKYMSQSREFLEKLMHEKAYIGMEANRLLPLASIQQDKECIEYFLGLDTANALEYLTKIDGFADRPAAEAFVEGVVQHLDLLRSDELYAHTHNKLLDGILKAKYTRARTRNGF